MTDIRQLASDWDAIVVGAGPAGIAAAQVLKGAGLSTLAVDENPAPGGQIWRAVTTTPLLDQSVLGLDYWAGLDPVRAALASGLPIATATSVWSVDRGGQVGISSNGVARMLTAKRVVIATGALERPFPVKGWTLPGVLTVGAAQGLLKSSGRVFSGRVVIAGCGPLLWLYAAQVLRAGGAIAHILDTTEAAQFRPASRGLAGFALSSYLAKGLALMAEVRRRVKVISRVTAIEIEGQERATGVRFEARGRSGQVAADVVLVHQGIVPQVNLAMAAGVPYQWDAEQLCFAPVADENGQTPLARILVAGDGAGIAGWEAAFARGTLAGIAAAQALGASGSLPNGRSERAQLRRKLRARGFLDRLYRPADAFRRPSGDVIVCRCEEVTAAEVEKGIDLGAIGPAQLKSYTRCGMGPCQGRLCGLTVTEMIAARRGLAPGDVGHYRLRPPVKPITLAELASLPADDAAVKAVVRS